MELRLFYKEDLEKIISLWSKTFGDSEDFIRNFLDISKPNTNLLVASHNGEIIGMINFPEISLIIDGIAYKGTYLFAVCVDEKHRKNGIFGKMSEKIDEIAISRGYDFAFLIPSSEGLFKMYEKFGYSEKCASYFPCETLEGIEKANFDFDMLYEKYRENCIKTASFIKDKQLFSYTVSDKLNDGCQIGKIGGEYVIYKNCDGKTVVFDSNYVEFYKSPKRMGLFKTYKNINLDKNVKFSLFFED